MYGTQNDPTRIEIKPSSLLALFLSLFLPTYTADEPTYILCYMGHLYHNCCCSSIRLLFYSLFLLFGFTSFFSSSSLLSIASVSQYPVLHSSEEVSETPFNPFPSLIQKGDPLRSSIRRHLSSPMLNILSVDLISTLVSTLVSTSTCTSALAGVFSTSPTRPWC